jgi:peptidoglycan-N-acetylglucosamine deacetylase
MDINRRSLIGGAAALGLFTRANSISARSRARAQLAITIDDFALPSTGMMSVLERDAAIRATLDKHSIKAAGFIAGMRVDNADGRSILKSWSDAGHILGNHSYSHTYFGKQNAKDYWNDVLKCEALLAPYRASRKLFRFPYLAEGTTRETRDAMRQKLKDNGYRNGVVTIDTSEWYIDGRMGKRLKEQPKASLAGYGKYYVDHMWKRAQYYDDLAKITFGKTIPHTLLIHHNDVTALFLNDAIAMFKNNGWDLISAEKAYRSPELNAIYDSLPSGQSLIWSAATANKTSSTLRYPAEDGRYEEAAMDALGL